jgi:hypothetical protein
MSCIYLISGCQKSPGGLGDLAYLGLTKRDGLERIEEHLYKFEHGTHSNQIVQNYYDQFGRGSLLTGIIIDCPEYYLNSIERFCIADLNTYTGDNPYGWNKSRGGEGAARYCPRFTLSDGKAVHNGNELYPFLIQHRELEPQNVLRLFDGSLFHYMGWKLL